MNLTSALRWAAIYRGIAWAAGLLPLGVAAAAMYFVGTNRIPRGTGEAIGVATTPYFVLPVLLALAVWQFVTTAAFYKTVTEATDEQMSERFDSEKVKSEVLEVLDDRLAEMQTELQRTRREVKELDGGSATTTGAPTSGAGTAGATGNAGPTGTGGTSETTGGSGNAGDSGSFDFED